MVSSCAKSNMFILGRILDTTLLRDFSTISLIKKFDWDSLNKWYRAGENIMGDHNLSDFRFVSCCGAKILREMKICGLDD